MGLDDHWVGDLHLDSQSDPMTISTDLPDGTTQDWRAESVQATPNTGRRRRAAPLQAFLRAPTSLKILFGNVLISGVAAVIALQVIGAPITGRMAGGLLLFVAVVVTLSTLLGFALLRLALTPLRGVADVADRVRRGDLEARAPTSRLADRSTLSLILLFNRMLDALRDSRARYRWLARSVLESEERERERIASELYAGPAQSLASVLVRLQLAQRKVLDPLPGSLAHSRELRDDVARALDEVRGLARALQPPELFELGVESAIEAHARTLTEDRPISVRVVGSLPTELDRHTATVLFRIVQEAVTKVVQRGRSSTIQVEFRTEPEQVVAEVVGRGGTEAETEPTSQLRISTMEDRAAHAGGTVTMDSTDRGATRIHVALPRVPDFDKGWFNDFQHAHDGAGSQPDDRTGARNDQEEPCFAG